MISRPIMKVNKKVEHPTLMKSGKFLEFFFGVAPTTFLFLGMGFLLFLLVIGAAIALGYSLVDTTQSLPQVSIFKPDGLETVCRIQWVRPELLSSLPGLFLGDYSCASPYWEDVDPSLLYGRAVLTFPAEKFRPGVCNQVLVPFYAVDTGELVHAFNYTAWFGQAEIFFYAGSDCSPDTLAFTVPIPGCEFFPTYTEFSSPNLDAFRSICVQNATKDQFTEITTFLDNTPGAICSAAIQPAELIAKCSDADTFSSVLPSTRSPQLITFSSSSTIFPALLQVLRNSVYLSSLFQTTTSLAFSVASCNGAALSKNQTAPFSLTDDALCYGLIFSACDRLCHLIYTLRPDLIVDWQYSHFDLIGHDITSCRNICASFNQTQLYTVFIEQMFTFIDFRSLRDWILQFLTRCLQGGNATSTGLITVRPGFFNGLEVSCSFQGEVPLSSNSVNLNRFVNVMSWIGIFQLFFASIFITALIVRAHYRHHHSSSSSLSRSDSDIS